MSLTLDTWEATLAPITALSPDHAELHRLRRIARYLHQKAERRKAEGLAAFDSIRARSGGAKFEHFSDPYAAERDAATIILNEAAAAEGGAWTVERRARRLEVRL